MGLGGLVAGCFQPMYAEHPLPGAAGSASVVGAMRAVDVAESMRPVAAGSPGSPSSVRNELIYDLTGGSGGVSPTHRLDVKLTATQLQVIVDINTARPDVNNYGIDSTYTLTNLATGKVVVKGQTFARVSYNIPGQEQRFAGERGLRDAENRAAKEIAENIRNPTRLVFRRRHVISRGVMTAIKAADVDRFIAKPDPAQPIVLVFGPDIGLVRERVDALVRASVDDPNDPFALARIEGDELAGNPARLVEEAHTVPLFGGRRAVLVKAGARKSPLRSKLLSPRLQANAASSLKPAISARVRRCARFVKKRKLPQPCPAMPIMSAHSTN